MPKISKKQVYVEKPKLSSVSKEINVVGERVEDALVLVEMMGFAQSVFCLKR